MKHCITTLLLFGLLLHDSDAALRHRWSFNEPAGSTTVADSVGGAHGNLIGTGQFNGSQLYLQGNYPGGPYVDLPNHIMADMPNATFEFWITWHGGWVWQRVFDFGINNAFQNTNTLGTIENGSGSGFSYVFFTPFSGQRTGKFVHAINGNGDEATRHTAGPILPLGRQMHVAITYDFVNNTSRIYYNGVLEATGPANTPLQYIPKVNVWLGRSNWTADNTFWGSYNEFRIYDTPLTAEEVYRSFVSGPDTVTPPGTLQSLTLTTPEKLFISRDYQLRATGDFASAAGRDVTEHPSISYTSSDPTVASVDNRGRVRTYAAGPVTFTVALEGKQDQKQVTILPHPPTPKHRYTFNEKPGSSTVRDRISFADGRLMGGGTFTGTALDSQGTAWVDLPNGMISALEGATFEAWVTWKGGGNWQRILDFGNNTGGFEGNGGAGLQFIYLTPNNGGGSIRVCVSLNGGGAQESTFTERAGAMALNALTHVAVTCNPVTRSLVLYVNGQRVGTAPLSVLLNQLVDYNNWLGRSNFTFDAIFNGLYHDFRIYDVALGDDEIQQSFINGPEFNGTLQWLTLQALPYMVVADQQRVTLLGNYSHAREVDITGAPEATFASSHPEVATVHANTGVITAVAPGITTITGTYQGVTGSVLVSVSRTASVLEHRYSFTTPGNTAFDSVGQAHGTVKAEADPLPVLIEEGRLVLNGTDGYVDLPNDLLNGWTDVSFEIWALWKGDVTGTNVVQHLFDFGTSSSGEGAPGYPVNFLYLTPRSEAGKLSFVLAENPDAPQKVVLEHTQAMPKNQWTHIVVSYNYGARRVSLYLNGVAVDRETAVVLPLGLVSTQNSWIGRSNSELDALFYGEVEEFRIYRGALNDQQVLDSYRDGPHRNPIVIRELSRLPDQSLRLRFDSIYPVSNHRVQAAVSLEPPQWTLLPAAALSPLAGREVQADFASPAGAFQLFRIQATPSLSVPPFYFQTFEEGTEGWTHGGTQDDWEWGQVQSGPGSARSGTRAWATRLAGAYRNGADAWLRTPVFDLGGARHARLSYWDYLDIEKEFDQAAVLIKSAADPNGAPLLELFRTKVSHRTWQERSFQIPGSIAAQPFVVEFRIQSDASITRPGWYLDDFGVTVE